MLHILLLILKIIALIVLCIIGLILLIVCAVLFASIRYKGHLIYGDEAIYAVKGHWLFGVISFYAGNENHKNRMIVRLFGYPIIDSQREKKQKKTSKKKKSETTEEILNINEEIPVQESEEKIPQEEIVKEEPVTEQATTEEPVIEQIAVEDSSTKESITKEAVGEKPKHGKHRKKTKEKHKPEKEKKESFFQKLSKIRDKKDQVMEIIGSDSGQRAIAKAKIRGIALLRHLKFKKIKGFIHFGFDDPAATGKILAVLAILYPIYDPSIKIEPDFREKVFECNVYVWGRIRIFNLLWFAYKIWFDKDVKKTIQDFKNI